MDNYFFGIIGSILLIAACWLFVRSLVHLLKGATTVGTIESFRTSEFQGSMSYFPVIIFHVQGDKTYRFTSTASSWFNKPPVEGLSVRVCYARENPSHAVIVSFQDLWFAPMVSLVLGACFICAAYGVPPIVIRLF